MDFLLNPFSNLKSGVISYFGLPPLVGSSFSQAVVSPLSATGQGVFANPYGHFDQETGEFVVTDIRTPRPWINVLANERYGLVVSQAGGGFSWYENCQLFRLNRWEQDLASDSYGRFVYVYDLEDHNTLWSTTLMPTLVDAECDTVRHGLGSTVFERTHQGIRTKQTLFVPLEQPMDIAIVDVTNTTDRKRELRLGTYLDWHLGTVGDWHREFHRLFTSVAVSGDTTFAWKRPGLVENVRVKSEVSPVGFVRIVGIESVLWFTDKQQWLGRLGQTGRPAAMFNDRVPTSTGRWDDPIAAARFEISLEPGETRTFAVVTGATEGQEEAVALARTVTIESARESLRETVRHHTEASSRLQIEFDDPVVDLTCNVWFPYQTTVGRMTARCAYYQQGGAFGFRDQLQDSLIYLDDNPGRTLRQIGIHAEAMYEDGSVRHWWHPNTAIFSKSRHSDTCLWLAFATLEYLEETCDLSSLDHVFTYAADSGVKKTGTLIDHCNKGIERALDHRSVRGLPLIGAGDWNDGLSHAGLDAKGESVWLAMFLFQILNRFSAVLTRLGDDRTSARYLREAESLKQAVETHGWDGEWYIAGTDDEGRPFGSSQCQEGSIFLNPQTWAVISGLADPERAKQAMHSVRKHLLKPYGALLLSPAYQDVDPHIGYITRYAPGLRENAGVYSHAATWAVQALAMQGSGDEAFALWRGMCPPVRASQNADLYAAEPYVMPGNSDGPDSPFEGRAGWTWYTGSSAWMRRIFVRWILGVRPTEAGLIVEPCLPSGTQGFKLSRPFRGDVFEISVTGGGDRTSHALLPTGTGQTHKVELG